MQIRAGGTADYAALEALLIRAYKPVVDRLAMDVANTFVASVGPAVIRYFQTGTWYLAEDRGELVGCVAYFAPRSTPHPRFRDNCAHVQLLGVVPSRVKQGVGRFLMLHCVHQAKLDGAETLALQTSEIMPAAIALYESIGFSAQDLPTPVWGHPAYLYVKALGDGNTERLGG